MPVTFEEFSERLLEAPETINYIDTGAAGFGSVDKGFQYANAIASHVSEAGREETCTNFHNRRLCDVFVYSESGDYFGFLTIQEFESLSEKCERRRKSLMDLDVLIPPYNESGFTLDGSYNGCITTEGACICIGSSGLSSLPLEYEECMRAIFDDGHNTKDILVALGYTQFGLQRVRGNYYLICHETKQFRKVSSGSRNYIGPWLYLMLANHVDALHVLRNKFKIVCPELLSISKPTFTNAAADTHNAQALRTLMDLAGVELGKRAFWRKGDIQGIFPELPWENGRVVLDAGQPCFAKALSEELAPKLQAVLTDNPTDMMFASTGQEYSSCFDLTSEYPYNTGLAAMATSAPVCMITLSTGSYVKKEWYNLGCGKRIKLRPLKMKVRAFVYLITIEDGTVLPCLGKVYGVGEANIDFTEKLFNTLLIQMFKRAPAYKDVYDIQNATDTRFAGHLLLTKVPVMYGKEKVHPFPYLDDLQSGSIPNDEANTFWDTKQLDPKNKRCFYFSRRGGDEASYALSKKGVDNIQSRIQRRVKMDKSLKLENYPLIEDAPEKKSVSRAFTPIPVEAPAVPWYFPTPELVSEAS